MRRASGSLQLTGLLNSLSALQCSPTELLFPGKVRLQGPGYQNVVFVDTGKRDNLDRAISFPEELLQELVKDREHGPLELIRVDDPDMSATASRGDYLVVDRGVHSVVGPGLYQIQIVGSKFWRYLTPSITGKIIVKSDDDRVATETVDESQLVILGRARAKLSSV